MLYVFGSLALMAMGVTMLIQPQFFYELTESWKHSGSSEPSELWVFSTRFGGVIFTLVGIAGLVLPFMS